MRKAKKGFTLIELIVVIAILGVLMAILIPSVTGYLKKARQSAANANAKSIYDQLRSNTVELGKQDITIADCRLSDPAENTPGRVGDCVEMNTWLASLPQSGSQFSFEEDENFGGYIDIIYKDGVPLGVAWSKESGSNAIIGRFPSAVTLNDGTEWSNWADVY